MKLYEVPRESKIKATIAKNGVEQEDMLTFWHIDGMYSYITTSNGDVTHLGASTEMVKVGDHYEIAEATQ